MKPSSLRYLENMKADLNEVLLPELTSPRARTLAAMMGQLLDQLMARETRLPAALAAHIQAERDLLAGLGGAAPAPGGADLFAEHEAVAGPLAERTRRLAASGTESEMRQVLAGLIEAEDRFDQANIHGGDAGRENAYRISSGQDAGSAKAARAAPATPERMTAYLRRCLPGQPDIRFVSLQPIPGGFSKDTIILNTEAAPGYEALVIRKDQSVSSHGYSAVNEFPTLARLFELGFPVAEPLWAESDAGVLGNPFLVSRKVAGTANMAAWAGNDADKRKIAGEVAAFLARLHNVDPADLPFDGTTRARSGATIGVWLIDELHVIWRRRRISPNPLMEFIFAWLYRHVPRQVARPALVHADLGFHNVMVENGTISAVLDWEFAHYGDPVEDLAYCQPFIEPVMPFEEFLALYRSHGGGAFDAATARFYRVLSTFRVAVGCYALMHALETGEAGVDSKIAFIGTMYARRFLIDAAKHISAP